MTNPKRTVLLLGASGTIGHATAEALIATGHEVIAPLRPGSHTSADAIAVPCKMSNADLASIMADHACDTVISCVASRSGAPVEARAIDYGLNSAALRAAVDAGVSQFVLLSAICVQKPRLTFQHAKLAFEAELQASPLSWTIVRPTAYFKSLSGQANRIREGKPFLLFGNGELTACKPISNSDLACFLVNCLTDPGARNRILPIGGPGPAITPRMQGNMLFEAMGRPPHFRHVPLPMMTVIIAGLSILGTVSQRLRDKAELARIGRYYATESMLVWNATTNRYDPDATPSFGNDTLADHYRRLASREVADDRGAHAVF